MAAYFAWVMVDDLTYSVLLSHLKKSALSWWTEFHLCYVHCRPLAGNSPDNFIWPSCVPSEFLATQRYVPKSPFVTEMMNSVMRVCWLSVFSRTRYFGPF